MARKHPIPPPPIEPTRLVPVEAIDHEPRWWQPRLLLEDSDLELLARAIRARGGTIDQPLTVRLTHVADRYELIAGQRRLLAARRAGISAVPVRIVSLTDEEAALVALAEHTSQKGFSVLEMGWVLAQVQARAPRPQKELAELLGRKENTVSEYLTVGRGVPEELVIPIARELDVPLARVLKLPKKTLLTIAYAEQEAEREQLVRAALRSLMTRRGTDSGSAGAREGAQLPYSFSTEAGGLHLHIPNLSGLTAEERDRIQKAVGIELSRASPTSPGGEKVRLAKFGDWKNAAQRLWRWLSNRIGETRIPLVQHVGEET